MTDNTENAKPTPAKSRAGKLFAFLLIVLSFFAGWYWLDYTKFTDQPLNIPAQGLAYTLKPGTSVKLEASLPRHNGTTTLLPIMETRSRNHQVRNSEGGDRYTKSPSLAACANVYQSQR